MVPRVLVVQDGPDLGEVERVVVPDGPSAVGLVECSPFDAVVVDVSREPLDGWFVLAALGARSARPRLVVVAPAADAARARALGADFWVPAGTGLDARALSMRTKEVPCPRCLATSSRRPTTSGAPA